MPQSFVFTDKDVNTAKREAQRRYRERKKDAETRGKNNVFCREEPLNPLPNWAKKQKWNKAKKYAWDSWFNLCLSLKKMLRDALEKRKIDCRNDDPMLAFEHDGNGTFTLHILQKLVSDTLGLPPTIVVQEDTSYEHYPLEAYNRFIEIIRSMRKKQKS